MSKEKLYPHKEKLGTWFSMPVEEMTHEDLLQLVAWLGEQLESLRKKVSALELGQTMAELEKAQKPTLLTKIFGVHETLPPPGRKETRNE